MAQALGIEEERSGERIAIAGRHEELHHTGVRRADPDHRAAGDQASRLAHGTLRRYRGSDEQEECATASDGAPETARARPGRGDCVSLERHRLRCQ